MAVNLLALANVSRAKLYQGQPATTEATVYTVPASTAVKVTSIVLCNTTSTPATVALSAVTAAGSAGAANRILSGFTVGANDTVTIETPVVLGAGDFLSALQGTASALTVTVTGETYA